MWSLSGPQLTDPARDRTRRMPGAKGKGHGPSRVPSMIKVEAVTHRFGERMVLRDIDLDLSERRIAVVGANGSGKSTFARLLNGLLVPDTGTVSVDGLTTGDRRQRREVQRRVGFIFQNPDSQIVFPLVEEDLAFGLKNLKLSKEEQARRVDAILDHYGLTHLRHQSTYLLSGGEKQLLAIAGVLAMEPRYLVLDEPTTLLDLRNRRRIQEVIAALDQPVVLVSHDLDMVRGFDRVIVFDDGAVVMDDRPEAALDFYVRSVA